MEQINRHTYDASIPHSGEMAELCFYLGNQFIQPDSAIIDIGSGAGRMLEPFVKASGDETNSFVGAYRSDEMIAQAQERFQGQRVILFHHDPNGNFPKYNVSLTLAICALEVFTLEAYQRLLQEAYHMTLPGGALIVVDRVLPHTAGLNDVFASTSYNFATPSEQLALRFRWYEEMLQGAGFQHVEAFWRSLNYAGWLAVRSA